MGIYAPVRTTEGQLRGVLALDLLLKRVQDLLAQAKLSPGSAAALVTDRGVVVARQPALFLMAERQRARRVRRPPVAGRDR